MRRILFMILTVMCGSAHVFADAGVDISSSLAQELAKHTADLNDAVAKKKHKQKPSSQSAKNLVLLLSN